MATDGRTARAALWSRYDDGALGTDELDARLKAVDRAGDDPDALERALQGPLPPAGGRRRLTAVAAVLAVTTVAVALSLGDTSPGTGATATTAAAVPAPLPVPPPVPPAPDCPELEEHLARFDAIDQETPAANPALLSDPPALPDGYAMIDQETLVPGTDPDIAMSVSAGDPPPLEILARSFAGDLDVTMRSWRYESAEAAAAAGRYVAQQGVCAYDLASFDVPGRPEIIGSVVAGPIPATAFASFRMAERRFTVAVVAADGGDEASLEAARQLAGAIASLEYDAARTEAPPR